MIVCVIGPPVSCQVFSFGDSNVTKKKDAMLMLRVFFSKKSDIFGQLDVVLRDIVAAIGGLLEILASRGMLNIYLNNIK